MGTPQRQSAPPARLLAAPPSQHEAPLQQRLCPERSHADARLRTRCRTEISGTIARPRPASTQLLTASRLNASSRPAGSTEAALQQLVELAPVDRALVAHHEHVIAQVGQHAGVAIAAARRARSGAFDRGRIGRPRDHRGRCARSAGAASTSPDSQRRQHPGLVTDHEPHVEARQPFAQPRDRRRQHIGGQRLPARHPQPSAGRLRPRGREPLRPRHASTSARSAYGSSARPGGSEVHRTRRSHQKRGARPAARAPAPRRRRWVVTRPAARRHG